MRLFKTCAIAIAATVLCSAAARADLVVTGIDRTVLATAGPMGTGGSTTSLASGFFLASHSGLGGLPGESVFASASQGSDTPTAGGPSMAGAGAAGGSVFAPSGSWSATGNSEFDVTFIVTADGSYLLDADVFWSGAGFVGFSVVSLAVDPPAGADIPIVAIDNSPGDTGSSSLTTIVPLFAGTSYHLIARTLVSGGGPSGTFSTSGDWEFSLTAVPESGAWLLTAPIAVGLAIAAWRRRRQPLAA